MRVDMTRSCTVRRPGATGAAGRLLLLLVALPLLGVAAPEPTVLRGVVRDPVDNAPLVGARVQVGQRTVRTGPDGTFEARVGRRHTGYLATRFDAAGYLPYETWTTAGAETQRTVYLFPAHPVELDEHDGTVSPEHLLDEFDIVYRDPIWRDPRGDSGWLWRWRDQPEIIIHTRVTEPVVDDGGWRLVATRNVPVAVRRYVRRILKRVTGPLTGGVLEPGRIRFRQLRRGEVVAGSQDRLYRPGEINVMFTDDGYYASGGGHIIAAHAYVDGPLGPSLTLDLDGCRQEHSLTECLTIVAGAPRLDVESLEAAIERGQDYLVEHEFAHVLGMQHRMTGSHGVGGTILCSVMGGPCDNYPGGEGIVTHVDVVLARLAYTRAPGNDQQDRDPYPGRPSP